MNLVKSLVQEGHDVTATRRERANTLFARKLGAKLIHADLDSEDSLVEAMRGRDVAFMCAGHYPRFSLDLDAEIAIARQRAANAVRAALRAKVQRFVLTSSVATIGPSSGSQELSNEQCPMTKPMLHSVYFAVKEAIESETFKGQAQGLDTVTLCPTGIMGPLDVKAGTGFVIVAVGNRMLPFHIDGRTNIVDVEDLAFAHIAAAERGRTGERYIVGGHNTTIRNLLDLLADELDVPLHSWRLPLWIAGGLTTLSEMKCAATHSSARPFMSREFVDVVKYGVWVDDSKARDELLLPCATPLSQTIRKACEWYMRHRYIPKKTLAAPSTAASDAE
jgi:dihydroflavonol-4-reductase